ncbi:MAG: hypothetical protein ACI9F9_001895 [Candidatus Paceibacteria bacterium]|jgi:hypothetical protein
MVGLLCLGMTGCSDVAPVTLTSAVNPLATASWSGTYSGEGMQVVLVQDGRACSGSITFAGAEYSLVAQVAGSELKGTFASGSDGFEFVARHSAGALELETGGALYRLQGKQSNPLGASARLDAQAGQESAPAAATSPLPTGDASSRDETDWGKSEYWERAIAQWESHQHSNGFSLKLPAGWSVQDQESNLQLLSPEGSFDDVSFFVVHHPLQGIDYVDDEDDFKKVMDNFVAQTPELGFKQQNKEMVRAPLGYQDLSIASFAGEQEGTKLYADVFLTEAGEEFEAFLFFAMSSNKAILDGEVRFLARALASSFGYAPTGESAVVASAPRPAGGQDAACVGSWISSSVYVSDGFSFASDSYLLLQADGVCTAGQSTGGGGGGVLYRSGGVEYTSRGTWATKDGTMDMRWESGNKPSHAYQILDVWESQDTLLWTTPDRVKWKRSQ